MSALAGIIDEHDAKMVLGRSILIVDDEEDIRGSVSRLLRAAFKGLGVEVAENGQAGLKKVRAAKESYDIILSDYRMPGINGVEFLQECMKITPESYRVMMTAFPDRRVSEEAATLAEVETFLTKPVDPITVLLAVKDLLRQRWLDTANS